MDALKLQDRVRFGQGIAALHIGQSADAYRPKSPYRPTQVEHRFLRFHAAFMPKEGGAARTNSYGNPEWYGIFDASYTKPGDYIVQGSATYFIADQQSFLPVLCVRTNRTISITRPWLQTAAGGVGYGGYINHNTTMVMEDWPVSMLGITDKGEPTSGLPTDQAVPHLTILMPGWETVQISQGDLVSDDLGRNAIITGSELTGLGWRLCAKLATN